MGWWGDEMGSVIEVLLCVDIHVYVNIYAWMWLCADGKGVNGGSKGMYACCCAKLVASV